MKLTFIGLAVAFATRTLAVDYNTVNGDIGNITNLLATLDTDAKAIVSGVEGLPVALQLEVDAVKLHDQIVASINDANVSPAFGSGGSLAIGLSFIELEPKIVSTLADVAAKNVTIGDLGIIVLSSLYQLKQDTDSFGSAVVAKLDSLEAAVAPGIIKNIDAAFVSAITAYGGKSEPKVIPT
jgi:hypothetical protein